MVNELEFGRVKESVKSAHKRIDNLDEKVEDVHILATAMAKTNEQVKTIKEDVT